MSKLITKSEKLIATLEANLAAATEKHTAATAERDAAEAESNAKEEAFATGAGAWADADKARQRKEQAEIRAKHLGRLAADAASKLEAGRVDLARAKLADGFDRAGDAATGAALAPIYEKAERARELIEEIAGELRRVHAEQNAAVDQVRAAGLDLGMDDNEIRGELAKRIRFLGTEDTQDKRSMHTLTTLVGAHLGGLAGLCAGRGDTIDRNDPATWLRLVPPEFLDRSQQSADVGPLLPKTNSAARWVRKVIG